MQVQQARFRSTVGALSAALAIWGGGVTSVPPAAAQSSITGYSVKDYLGVTVFREVEVAPNGRHVAFIVATDDFAQDREEVAVWRLDLDENGRKTALTRLTWEPSEYSELRWSSDARSLSFLVPDGGGNGTSAQLHVMSVLGGESRQITDSAQFASGIDTYDWAPDGRYIMLAAAAPLGSAQRRARTQFYGDARRLNGEVPRGAFFRLDSSRFGSRNATLMTVVPFPVAEVRHSPGGRRVAFRSKEAPTGYSDSFSEVEVYDMPVTGSDAPRQLTRNFAIEDGIAWLRDGGGLYMGGFGDEVAERNVMTNSRLYAVKLDGSTSKNVLPGFEGSVEEFALLPDGSLLAAAIVSTNLNIYRVTAAARADTAPRRVDKLTSYRGRVLNLSASRDGKVIAYVMTDHQSFPELFVASGWTALAGGRVVRVTYFNASIDALAKPEVETIQWSNGEGDTIEGVLYWPPGRRGAKNLPFVQRMHGGPWLASTEALIPSTSRFMYYGALLATRGYLVLETNYRGSVGRGDDFLHAIEGYGCSRPATDILTGVDYVIARGWADSTRMGVGGWSYGGILTNCLIGRTTRFRAAASGAGDWNETSAFGTGDTFYWYHVMNGGKPPWEHLEQYWAESGISTASRVRTPTIFTHGDADGVVPTSQGYEAYRSLVWLGVPTELLVFPDEGHVFRKPSHKVTKVEAELAWFEKYLLAKR
ncbi:MAG: prolyl oligopeptidase family serine peptidase [Gemmatimonadaceae bacterium]